MLTVLHIRGSLPLQNPFSFTISSNIGPHNLREHHLNKRATNILCWFIRKEFKVSSQQGFFFFLPKIITIIEEVIDCLLLDHLHASSSSSSPKKRIDIYQIIICYRSMKKRQSDEFSKQYD